MKTILTPSLFLLLLFQILSQEVYSQYVTVDEDKLDFEIKHTKSANSVFNASTVHFSSDNISRIKINLKMKTENGKRVMFDPNKFSFLDHENNLRFRPTDITFQNMTDFLSFTKCSRKELMKYKRRLLYKPDLEDSYFNYTPMGYKNKIQPVNYGTKGKPDLHMVFFHPKKMRNRNIHLFIVVPKSMKTGSLYYGDTKLTDLNINEL